MPIYTGTPALPSGLAGEILEADDGWTAILDALRALTGTWTSYTPSWTATSINPAIGDGTIEGKYLRSGGLAIVVIRIAMGASTTFGTGQWRISLPITLASAGLGGAGVTVLSDSGTAGNRQNGSCSAASTTTIRMWSQAGEVDATTPFAWATSDDIRITYTCEAAA